MNAKVFKDLPHFRFVVNDIIPLLHFFFQIARRVHVFSNARKGDIRAMPDNTDLPLAEMDLRRLIVHELFDLDSTPVRINLSRKDMRRERRSRQEVI